VKTHFQSLKFNLYRYEQAMLRSVGPKWGRGVMPDQRDASDLDGLLLQPEVGLFPYTLHQVDPFQTYATDENKMNGVRR
jgi:hypothetical protein